MAFWRGETLEVKLKTLVEPFDPRAIDCAAYTLHIGSEVYVSPDQKLSHPKRQTKYRLAKGEGFIIPPGQFAFLVTDETIEIPNDAIGFISIKARLKLSGLVNISGFHVDPGYKGKLLFSVLNSGPKPLHLAQGQPLFLIWYADLDAPTEYRKKGSGFSDLDPTLINSISGEILSLQSISDAFRELESRTENRINQLSVSVAWLKATISVLITITLAIFGGVAVALLSEPMRQWLAKVLES